ncbi:hypothetical protein CMI37_29415 [Candidatus Pacearchaeota archaeon]|nr:hypothetical protein [Candidatus Pacearchaeota archaeon]
MTPTEQIMAQIWEAFCTLSDAQELISMGETKRANSLINHAKLHLTEAQDIDPDAQRAGILKKDFGCILSDKKKEIAAKNGW